MMHSGDVRMSGSGSEFDTAKAIAEILSGVEEGKRARILRWVFESLGIQTIADNDRQEGQGPAIFNTGEQAAQGGHRDHHSGPKTRLDIKSFIDQKAPKTDAQFATAVAYYYQFEAPPDKRREVITPSELQEATRLAGRSRLKSPKTTLNNTKNQGYLDSAARGQFKINSVGENLVAMTLPGGGATLSTKPGKAKRKQKKQ